MNYRSRESPTGFHHGFHCSPRVSPSRHWSLITKTLDEQGSGVVPQAETGLGRHQPIRKLRLAAYPRGPRGLRGLRRPRMVRGHATAAHCCQLRCQQNDSGSTRHCRSSVHAHDLVCLQRPLLLFSPLPFGQTINWAVKRSLPRSSRWVRRTAQPQAAAQSADNFPVRSGYSWWTPSAAKLHPPDARHTADRCP